MSQAMKSLQSAMAAMAKSGSKPGQHSQARGMRPGHKPGQGSKPGQEMAKGQGQGKTRSPSDHPAKGEGNRVASGSSRQEQPAAQFKDVKGDGSFLMLPARQRDLIKQALSEKLPPDYAAMIQQYYLNLARGKPAAKPRPGDLMTKPKKDEGR
jgi:hypothetical protein